MRRRIVRLLASLAAAAAWMALLVGVTPAVDPPRLLVMLGGTMPEGLIQGLTWWLFLFGMTEVVWLRMRIAAEADAFTARLLPEEENYILSAEDANRIKLSMQQIEHARRYLLTDLIKKACTKYRLSKSSSEALALTEAQIRLYDAELESEHSYADYAAWAIPSVGFIGTVIGIAASLGFAGEASTPEGIARVTGMLAVAFDTTLVALVASLPLMYEIHALGKQQQAFFTRMESYVIENLINRFYQ